MTMKKARIKAVRELANKKHRDEQNKFLIEGMRFVHEAMSSDFPILEVFYTDEFAQDPHGKILLHDLGKKCHEIERVSVRELESMSSTVSAQGVLAVLQQREYNSDAMLNCTDGQCMLVAFDAISDPGNVGSMVRTCDWFGVDGVLIGRNSAELYNPKVLRATMGGIFHLPIAEDVDLLSALSKAKALGYKVYVTDVNGETHYDHVTYESKSVMVFGNEAWGVSDQIKALADVRLVIRRYGAAESLNVGASCGIVLSAMHRLYN